jgi:hypothetical protein
MHKSITFKPTKRRFEESTKTQWPLLTLPSNGSSYISMPLLPICGT